VLDGTRMEHVMPVYATVDEALAALRAVAVGSS
jgi:hypothetical protein